MIDPNPNKRPHMCEVVAAFLYLSVRVKKATPTRTSLPAHSNPHPPSVQSPHPVPLAATRVFDSKVSAIGGNARAGLTTPTDKIRTAAAVDVVAPDRTFGGLPARTPETAVRRWSGCFQYQPQSPGVRFLANNEISTNAEPSAHRYPSSPPPPPVRQVHSPKPARCWPAGTVDDSMAIVAGGCSGGWWARATGLTTAGGSTVVSVNHSPYHDCLSVGVPTPTGREISVGQRVCPPSSHEGQVASDAGRLQRHIRRKETPMHEGSAATGTTRSTSRCPPAPSPVQFLDSSPFFQQTELEGLALSSVASGGAGGSPAAADLESMRQSLPVAEGALVRGSAGSSQQQQPPQAPPLAHVRDLSTSEGEHDSRRSMVMATYRTGVLGSRPLPTQTSGSSHNHSDCALPGGKEHGQRGVEASPTATPSTRRRLVRWSDDNEGRDTAMKCSGLRVKAALPREGPLTDPCTTMVALESTFLEENIMRESARLKQVEAELKALIGVAGGMSVSADSENPVASVPAAVSVPRPFTKCIPYSAQSRNHLAEGILKDVLGMATDGTGVCMPDKRQINAKTTIIDTPAADDGGGSAGREAALVSIQARGRRLSGSNRRRRSMAQCGQDGVVVEETAPVLEPDATHDGKGGDRVWQSCGDAEVDVASGLELAWVVQTDG